MVDLISSVELAEALNFPYEKLKKLWRSEWIKPDHTLPNGNHLWDLERIKPVIEEYYRKRKEHKHGRKQRAHDRYIRLRDAKRAETLKD